MTAVGGQFLVGTSAIALNSATAATARTLLLVLIVSGAAATAAAAHVCACIPVLLHLKLLLLCITISEDVAPAHALGPAVLQRSLLLMLLTHLVALQPPLTEMLRFQPPLTLLLLLLLHKEWLVRGSLFTSLSQWLAAVCKV
jgi:hypothetical protein